MSKLADLERELDTDIRRALDAVMPMLEADQPTSSADGRLDEAAGNEKGSVVRFVSDQGARRWGWWVASAAAVVAVLVGGLAVIGDRADNQPVPDASSPEPLVSADTASPGQTPSPDLDDSFPLDGLDPYDAAAALFLEVRIGPNPDEQADLEAAGEILVRDCLRTGGASPPVVTADDHQAFRDELNDAYIFRTNAFTRAGLEYRRQNGFIRQAEPFDPNADTPLHLTIEEGSLEEQLMIDGCGSADDAVRQTPSEAALRASTFENSDTRWYSLGPADLPEFANGYEAYDECMNAAGYEHHDAVGPGNPFSDLFYRPDYTDDERDAVNADADCRISTDLPANYVDALAPLLDEFDDTYDSEIAAIRAERDAALDTARSIMRDTEIEPFTS